MRYGDDNLGAIGVKKIQELLLDSEGATQRNLAKPMVFHYQKMKNTLDRMQMLTALKLSLDNEATNEALMAARLAARSRALAYERPHEWLRFRASTDVKIAIRARPSAAW